MIILTFIKCMLSSVNQTLFGGAHSIAPHISRLG